MTATPASPADSPPYRYSGVLAGDIEARWQAHWESHGTFDAPNPAGPFFDPAALDGRPATFVLDMFPYPSGAGLHVGHPLGYIATDIYCRFLRSQGHHVLYTMGFDAFGLPAEQYAVQTGQHPAITTNAAVDNMRRQLRRIGLSYDQRRSITTIDPQYYRWTQWIFLQIFNSWYDGDAGRARPITELIAELDAGTRSLDDGRDWSALSPEERTGALESYRLAYVSNAPVNWCPGLGTVVANEEVTSEGRSDRGNFPVFKRTMRQWMMRITTYADRLIDDLDLLRWPEPIKTMQRNWIGRSEGASVRFDTAAGPLEVFTTRPDTLFGATFMVLAPEHPLVDSLTTAAQADEVRRYRAAAEAKKDVDRQDDNRAKTGVFTGSYATNPVNGEPVPVWIADYVLMGYGTGAIMAVPCGDQRDFEFARQFGLPIVAIQAPDGWPADTARWAAAYVGDAPFVASDNGSLNLNGIASVAEAKRRTIDWLEEHDHGTGAVTYRLRDWLFSRQRYWGEPFPIVYDEHGHPHDLPEEALPLVLPETDSFSPRTFDPDDAASDPESPLDRLTDWVQVTLDLGDGPRQYRRDTNVMPQWAGSCWYELRYLDPANDERFVDPAVERYWMGPDTAVSDDHPGGVDLYVGGVEHAVLHLLYTRFWHKILFDLGHVSSREPYYRLFNQGYILAEAFQDERGIYVDAVAVERHEDGTFTYERRPVQREFGKMGKSLKNAVAPDEIYNAYGADTLRLYEMSMGPLEASRPWETRDVVGMYRFLQRLWRNLVDESTGEISVDTPVTDELLRHLHRTIAGVTDDMANLRFNTAIAKLIELNNALTKAGGCPKELAEPLVVMVAPLAPHLAEELWAKLGHTSSVSGHPFPVADPAMLVTDEIEVPVQVNGKVRGRITVAADAAADAVQATALADPRVRAALAGATPTKVIVVPGRMVNIVA